MTRPSEKLIETYIKEDGGDDAPTQHEDASKVKEKLDALAAEHDMRPMDMEDAEDGMGGSYTCKGENAEAFANAADEALAQMCGAVDTTASGKLATVEFEYK